MPRPETGTAVRTGAIQHLPLLFLQTVFWSPLVGDQELKSRPLGRHLSGSVATGWEAGVSCR